MRKAGTWERLAHKRFTVPRLAHEQGVGRRQAEGWHLGWRLLRAEERARGRRWRSQELKSSSSSSGKSVNDFCEHFPIFCALLEFLFHFGLNKYCTWTIWMNTTTRIILSRTWTLHKLAIALKQFKKRTCYSPVLGTAQLDDQLYRMTLASTQVRSFALNMCIVQSRGQTALLWVFFSEGFF